MSKLKLHVPHIANTVLGYKLTNFMHMKNWVWFKQTHVALLRLCLQNKRKFTLFKYLLIYRIWTRMFLLHTHIWFNFRGIEMLSKMKQISFLSQIKRLLERLHYKVSLVKRHNSLLLVLNSISFLIFWKYLILKVFPRSVKNIKCQ